jgi:hypothetical protein
MAGGFTYFKCSDPEMFRNNQRAGRIDKNSQNNGLEL